MNSSKHDRFIIISLRIMYLMFHFLLLLIFYESVCLLHVTKIRRETESLQYKELKLRLLWRMDKEYIDSLSFTCSYMKNIYIYMYYDADVVDIVMDCGTFL